MHSAIATFATTLLWLILVVYPTAGDPFHRMVSSSSTVRRDDSQTLVPQKYDLLPVGVVQPQGWFKDQLQLESDGLAGHLFDFYRYVKRSQWLGGVDEYSELHESAPYWYNGIVPLAYVLNDTRLINQANQFLTYTLEHQASDGWLGPETTRQTRGIWARCLLLQGMMNHAIADENQAEKIVDSIFRFTSLANAMLKANYTGFIQQAGDDFDPWGFGLARAHELSTTLQWLYETYPGRNDSLLWETMELMWSGAIAAKRDWATFFVKGVFPETATVKAKSNMEHGVNLAQGLRYMYQKYRMTRNESLVQQTREAVNMTIMYQSSLSGSIIADEYLGGLSPQRGSELCMAVEVMFSMSYLYRAIGDNLFADRAELVAFNALPGGIAPDWWSHQYVTQTNQPWSRNLTGKPFFNVVSYGNVFGLEPNFPCCTVNHPQALPKFLISSFVKKGKSGLVHQHLIPASASIEIQGGKASISCDTNYPFGQTLQYTIHSTASWIFYIRVPGWATSSSTIKIGKQSQSLSADKDGLQKVDIGKGLTHITVTFGLEVRVVPRENNTVAIYRGALLYALDIDYNISSSIPLNWTDRAPLPAFEFDSRVQDHEYVPVTENSWAIGIDVSQITVHDTSDSCTNLANPIFGRGGPPVYMEVAASQIVWPEDKGTASLPPANPQLVGEPFIARLVPYGSAKLHMAQLPLINLESVTKAHTRALS